jgi:hypothetical protein
MRQYSLVLAFSALALIGCDKLWSAEEERNFLESCAEQSKGQSQFCECSLSIAKKSFRASEIDTAMQENSLAAQVFRREIEDKCLKFVLPK